MLEQSAVQCSDSTTLVGNKRECHMENTPVLLRKSEAAGVEHRPVLLAARAMVVVAGLVERCALDLRRERNSQDQP